MRPSRLLTTLACFVLAGALCGAEGFLAEYYIGKVPQGDPVLTRTDLAIAFDWGLGSPDPSLPNDQFSARWSALLTAPASGTYTFVVTRDDGARFWLDDLSLVSDWTNSIGTNTVQVALEAGRTYRIRVDYMEVSVNARIKLEWSGPGFARRAVSGADVVAAPVYLPVPAAVAVQAIDSEQTMVTWLHRDPLAQSYEIEQWHEGAWVPRAVVPAPEERWCGVTSSDTDGLRMRIASLGSNGTRSAWVDVATTAHPAGTPAVGFLVQFWDNIDFTGSTLILPAYRIDQLWATGSPIPSISSDSFSVRWLGRVQAPVSGTAVLRSRSDDGVRVWFDGQRVVDRWNNHGTMTDQVDVAITAGQWHDVQVDFYENYGNAVMQLDWRLPGATTFSPIGVVPRPVDGIDTTGGVGFAGALVVHGDVMDPVNDAPTLTTVTALAGATEDTAFVVSYAALQGAANEADVDSTPVNFRVEAVSAGTLGYRAAGTTDTPTAVTAGATILDATNELVWTPAANANGLINAFTITAYDGALASATAVAVPVNVAAVNDAPTLTMVTALSGAIEDTAFVVSYAALQGVADEADVDSTPVNFRIEAVSAGTLGMRAAGTTGTATAVVAGTTILDVANELVWTPATHANGLINGFTIKADDGVLASATAIAVPVNVTAVNDPPTVPATPGIAVQVAEGSQTGRKSMPDGQGGTVYLSKNTELDFLVSLGASDWTVAERGISASGANYPVTGAAIPEGRHSVTGWARLTWNGQEQTVTSDPISLLVDRTKPTLRWITPGSSGPTAPALNASLDPAGPFVRLNSGTDEQNQQVRSALGWLCWPRAGFTVTAYIDDASGVATSPAPVVTVGAAALDVVLLGGTSDSDPPRITVSGFASVPDAVTAMADTLTLQAGAGLQALSAQVQDGCGNALDAEQFNLWVKAQASPARLGYLPVTRGGFASTIGIIPPDGDTDFDGAKLLATPCDVVTVLQVPAADATTGSVARRLSAGPATMAALAGATPVLWELPTVLRAHAVAGGESELPDGRNEVLRGWVRTLDMAGNISEVQTLSAWPRSFTLPAPPSGSATAIESLQSTDTIRTREYTWDWFYWEISPNEDIWMINTEGAQGRTIWYRGDTVGTRHHQVMPLTTVREQPVGGVSSLDMQMTDVHGTIKHTDASGGLVDDGLPSCLGSWTEAPDISVVGVGEDIDYTECLPTWYFMVNPSDDLVQDIGIFSGPGAAGALVKDTIHQEGFAYFNPYMPPDYAGVEDKRIFDAHVAVDVEMGSGSQSDCSYVWSSLRYTQLRMATVPSSWSTMATSVTIPSAHGNGRITYAHTGAPQETASAASASSGIAVPVQRQTPGGLVRVPWIDGDKQQPFGFGAANLLRIDQDVLAAGAASQFAIDGYFVDIPFPGSSVAAPDPSCVRIIAADLRALSEQGLSTWDGTSQTLPAMTGNLTAYTTWLDGLSTVPSTMSAQQIIRRAYAIRHGGAIVVSDATLDGLDEWYASALASAPDASALSQHLTLDTITSATNAFRDAEGDFADLEGENQLFRDQQGSWDAGLAQALLQQAITCEHQRVAVIQGIVSGWDAYRTEAEQAYDDFLQQIAAVYDGVDDGGVWASIQEEMVTAPDEKPQWASAYFEEVQSATGYPGPVSELQGIGYPQYFTRTYYYPTGYRIALAQANSLVQAIRDGAEYQQAEARVSHALGSSQPKTAWVVSQATAIVQAFAGQSKQPNELPISTWIDVVGVRLDMSATPSPLSQRLIVEVDMGSETVGLYDVEVNCGYVKAYPDELSQQYAGADGAHRMKEALMVLSHQWVAPSDESNPDSERVPTSHVSVSNPCPVVNITECRVVSVSDSSVTVTIAGTVNDAIADNAPRGMGADIEQLMVKCDGVTCGTIAIQSEDDGPAVRWRQHPYIGNFTGQISVNAGLGEHLLRIETSANGAGNIGYSESILVIEQQLIPGTSGGGSGMADIGTVSYPGGQTGDSTSSMTLTLADTSSGILANSQENESEYNGRISNSQNVGIQVVCVTDPIVALSASPDAFQAKFYFRWENGTQAIFDAVCNETASESGVFTIMVIMPSGGQEDGGLTVNTARIGVVSRSGPGSYHPFSFRAKPKDGVSPTAYKVSLNGHEEAKLREVDVDGWSMVEGSSDFIAILTNGSGASAASKTMLYFKDGKKTESVDGNRIKGYAAPPDLVLSHAVKAAIEVAVDVSAAPEDVLILGMVGGQIHCQWRHAKGTAIPKEYRVYVDKTNADANPFKDKIPDGLVPLTVGQGVVYNAHDKGYTVKEGRDLGSFMILFPDRADEGKKYWVLIRGYDPAKNTESTNTAATQVIVDYPDLAGRRDESKANFYVSYCGDTNDVFWVEGGGVSKCGVCEREGATKGVSMWRVARTTKRHAGASADYYSDDVSFKFDEMAAKCEGPNGVFVKDRESFGNWSDVDSNGRFCVLVTSLFRNYGGYAWLSNDGRRPWGAAEIGEKWYNKSNYSDLVYINLSGQISTVAHELQHNIHGLADPSEKLWVNEGCSRYAEELNGVARFSADYFANNANKLTLTRFGERDVWRRFGICPACSRGPGREHNEEGRNIWIAQYSTVALWTQYADNNVPHKAGQSIRTLVGDSATGIEGFNRLFTVPMLQNPGGAFIDWTVANYVNKLLPDSGDVRYKFKKWGRFGVVESVIPANGTYTTRSVRDLAADYVRVASGLSGNMKIMIKGITDWGMVAVNTVRLDSTGGFIDVCTLNGVADTGDSTTMVYSVPGLAGGAYSSVTIVITNLVSEADAAYVQNYEIKAIVTP